MANARILLMAKANKLGIDGYRNMSDDELKDVIARAETGTKKSAPAKGKASPASSNGKAAPAKGKAAPAKGKATPAKGKSAPAKGKASTSTSAPAKSTRQKSAPAKGTAAKGAQAKRPTTARGNRKAVASGTRQPLGKIKWNIESNVGTTGKRKEVLDALREHKGDKSAAFKQLKRKATKFYPDKDQHAAERMLVWLIGRVAYDYAYKTGQHEPGERAAYGTSTKPQDVKRREARNGATKTRRKPRAATSTRKAAPAKGRATKAAAKRTSGRKTTAAKRGRR